MRAKPDRAYLGACTIYRNNAGYLAEWIEVHRLFGFERFFLYDNGSTDDHLEVLAPYIEDGSVSVHDWPMPFLGRQGRAGAIVQAFEHCLGEHRDDARWIAFLDLDEFLFSPTGERVSQILPEFEDFPGVGVNCLAYGTSGHETRPDGLAIENYVMRTEIDFRNRIIKTIADPTRVASVGNNPHYFKYLDGARAVNEKKDPIKGSTTDELSCERLRINHYMTRSQEERDVKLSRPIPYTAEPRPAERARERDKELNDVRDDLLVRLAPEVRRALSASLTSE
jgi:Glycosyltransferase family 92